MMVMEFEIRSLRRSTSLLIPLLLLLIIGVAPAFAIEVSREWRWSDSAMGTLPNATTNVRGYARSSIAEDPNGTYGSGAFRNHGGVDVALATGSSTSDVNVTVNSDTKTIKVSCKRGTFEGNCLAAGKDPFVFSPGALSRTLELDVGISDFLIDTGLMETGQLFSSAQVTLGGSPIPIFDLTISASNGSTPSVSLTVHSAAQGQGWNQAALTSSLTAAITPTANPGEYELTNFDFPMLTFNLPASTSGVLETLDEVLLAAPPSIPAVSEWGALVLVVLLASLGIMVLVKRRIPVS